MKRLHLYLIKSFLGPFFLAFAIAMIVLMLNFVWLYIDELVGKGLEWTVVAELITYVSLRQIPMALILGTLLASVMTFGSLGEHNELTALKSSGISLLRTMVPILIFVILLGLSSLTFSNYVIPHTNTKFFTLLYDIQRQRPEFDIKEGQFYDGIDGYSIYIGDRSKDGKTLYNLMIYDHTKNKGNVGVTVADSGYMRIAGDKESIVLNLFNGSSFEEQLSEDNNIQDNKPLRRDIFSNQKVVFNIPGSELIRTKEDRYRYLYMTLNMRQLKDTANGRHGEMIWKRKKVGHELLEHEYLRLENKKEVREDPNYYSKQPNSTDPKELVLALPIQDQREVYLQALIFARSVKTRLNNSQREMDIRNKGENMYWNEWNRKMVYGLACLLFFLIGAPLGAIIRKGGLGTPVVVSIIFFILFYMLTNAGEKYARADFVPSWAGMWISSVVLLPLGVLLTIKSNKDSKILSTESYTLVFREIINKLRRSEK